MQNDAAIFLVCIYGYRYAKALKWYRKAAEQGNPSAKLKLALEN